MAVPVRNYTGKIVAAVSASIPVFRVDDKKKEFVLDELNRTAGQISKELGYLG
ncbi:MAG: IclR family transcriptional regulator C-terminal domain-containing protein [Anaerostipes hadrus]